MTRDTTTVEIDTRQYDTLIDELQRVAACYDPGSPDEFDFAEWAAWFGDKSESEREQYRQDVESTLTTIQRAAVDDLGSDIQEDT